MLENFVAKIRSDFALSSSWVLFPFFLLFFFFLFYVGVENILKIFLFSSNVEKKYVTWFPCSWTSKFCLVSDMLDVWPATWWFALSLPDLHPLSPGGQCEWKGVGLCIYHNHASQLKVIFMLFICLKIITAICLKSQEVFQ